jgi:hypothetical protein
MSITAVSLVDGANEMIIKPRDGLFLADLSAPWPAVRATTEPRTDGDGERDTTKFFGARACSLELLVTQTPAAVHDELARFCHPASRPYLVVTDDEWTGPRRLRLRVDNIDDPIEAKLAPTARKIQAQWKVPDGVWEDASEVTTVISADAPSTGGLAMPVTMPATFADSTSAGAALVLNAGAVPLHWIARLYGPCTAPQFTLDSAGLALVFKPTLVLGGGEYLEIDSRERTAWANGDTSISRLNYLDYTVSTWWQLPVGENQVRYNPASGIGAGSIAELYTRTQWL